MKTLVIPDIHGEGAWLSAYNIFDKYDKVVFLGDYCDGRGDDTVPDGTILTFLGDAIDLKKEQPDKFELLLGNHDIQYFYPGKYSCSRFRLSMAYELSELFAANKDLFKVAYQHNNFLFTHAGMSRGWLAENLPTLTAHGLDGNNYAEALNNMMASPHERVRDILHQVSAYRGGMYNFGGITWADMMETQDDMIEGLHQIVGHTPVRTVTTVVVAKKSAHEQNASFTYTDCLQTNSQLASFETALPDLRGMSIVDLTPHLYPPTIRDVDRYILDNAPDAYATYTPPTAPLIGNDYIIDHFQGNELPVDDFAIGDPVDAAGDRMQQELEDYLGTDPAEQDALDEDETAAAFQRQEDRERELYLQRARETLREANEITRHRTDQNVDDPTQDNRIAPY